MTDKSGQITMTTNPTQDATRMETLAAALVVFFCFMNKIQMTNNDNSGQKQDRHATTKTNKTVLDLTRRTTTTHKTLIRSYDYGR